MADRKLIAVWGWFGYRNCGDDLLLLNLVGDLKNALGDAAQIIIFGSEENLKDILPQKNVCVVKRTALNALLCALKTDLFLVGPGGLFPSANTKKLLFYWMLTGIMKMRGKRIGYIGVGIGIGTFERKRDICIFNGIAGMSDVFISRSENYQSFLSSMQKKNILLAADMVFADRKLYGWKKSGSAKLVVVALADIFVSNTKEYKENFIKEMIRLFNYILGKGYEVHLVPFTNVMDQHFHDEICRRMGSDGIKSIPYQRDPYKTYGEIAQGMFCIGMRFHALVMSLILGMPTLSVSYSDKNEDIMKRFGLSEYSVRFGISEKEYYNEEIMIDAKELISIFEEMEMREAQIKDAIAKHMPKIREQSEINIRELKKLLGT